MTALAAESRPDSAPACFLPELAAESRLMSDRDLAAPSRPFRIVLLDDDEDARAHFRSLLPRHPALRLCGEAASLKEALEIIVASGAGILFLESEIGGESLFEDCALIPPSVRLVFLSRRDAGALRAFELDALDFLIKPLAPTRLAETVRRMLRIDWPRPETAPEPDSRILIPFERGRRGASLEEICVVQAFGNYTRVSLIDGKSEIVLRSLSKWEGLLPSPPFLRIHRNAIVHSARVRKLEEQEGGCVVQVEGMEEPLAVSRRCLAEVRQVLFAKA